MPYNSRKDQWVCGHPRTIENAYGGQMRYGCKECQSRKRRDHRYRTLGFDQSPLPVAYRNALRPVARHYTNRGGRYLRLRVRTLVNEAGQLDRACFMLRSIYGKPVEEIAHWLELSSEEVERRDAAMRRQLGKTAHLDKQNKDWALIREILDSGVAERDCREMCGVSENGWRKAKARGDI